MSSVSYPKIDPAKVVLITDIGHPLYDPRAEGKPDKSLVANILHYGVIEPIIVRKVEGDKLEVVAGRRRVLAAREVNRLVKEKKAADYDGTELLQPIEIPYRLTNGSDEATHVGVKVSENVYREDESILERARQAVSFMTAQGVTPELTCLTFKISASTLRNYKALVENCSKDVQKAVVTGAIPFANAVQDLAKLPKEKQGEALAKLLESGAVRGAAGKANARAASKGEKPGASKKRCRPAKEVEKAIRVLNKHVEGREKDAVVAALKWCLGSDSSLNDYKGIVAALYPEDEEEEEGEK